MALAYLDEGDDRAGDVQPVQSQAPGGPGFLAAAGLADALDYLERFGVDDGDMEVVPWPHPAGAGPWPRGVARRGHAEVGPGGPRRRNTSRLFGLGSTVTVANSAPVSLRTQQ
jgi:hypothetical protein